MFSFRSVQNLIFLLFIGLFCAGGGLTGCKKFEVTQKVIVKTTEASDVTSSTTRVSGILVDAGPSGVTEIGFGWALSPNVASIIDYQPQEGTPSLGAFSSTIGGLQPNTEYYLWAYAMNEEGRIYGAPIDFTTLRVVTPIVYTGSDVSVLGPSEVVCSFEVYSDGMSESVEAGICYAIGVDPTIDGPHTSRWVGKGTYLDTLRGLTPGTTYRYRAYAANAAGVDYGYTREFNTPPAWERPEVATHPAEEVTETSARVGGSIISDGGQEIIAKGICWGTEPTPTVDGNVLAMGAGLDPFDDVLDGLAPDTDYFIRAFAENSEGIGYGEPVGFRTRTDPLEDTRNGKTYPTVRIGDQVWMAANLDIGELINGSLEGTDDGVIQKYCYQNNPAYCEEYGALYSWEEMMQWDLTEGARGVCPEGWHIPSDEEWKILEMTLGMTRAEADGEDWRGTDEGGKLKAAESELWDSPNEGATNESGFNALPNGGVDNTGVFGGQGQFAHYWTSSRVDPDPWYRLVQFDRADILRTRGNKGYGTSVRCVKD